MIGIIGAGLVGARTAEHVLTQGQVQLLLNDTNPSAATKLASAMARQSAKISVVDQSAIFGANVVVLACPGPHAKAAQKLLEGGVSVVSCSDDVDDVLALLDLDAVARQSRQTLVVGATASPGLSGLQIGRAHV